jgi:NAD(P)-dependent dehydrogenase (short-subunit alcohol dehydrogenase family)
VVPTLVLSDVLPAFRAPRLRLQDCARQSPARAPEVAVDELMGRVAVITGAAGGIGRGIAVALADAGMRLVLADRDQERLAATGAQLRETGAAVADVPTDVRDPGAVEALAAATLDAYGAVDVVCNNAGVWTLGSQWETSPEDWHWVVDVNLWGVIHGVRTFVPLLLRNASGGHVVNVASIAGLIGGPLSGPYTATKHAVVGLSKGLRADLAASGAEVGVSVVCPGRVQTAIFDNVGRRPEATGEPQLTPPAQAVLDALRGAAATEMPPDEVGRLVRDAIIRDQFWVLPNAEAHLPLVAQDFQELKEAFAAGASG